MYALPAASVESTYYEVDAVRAIDRAAIEGAGIEGYTLMTRAAGAALDATIARFPSARHWLFLCGGGNNAGDGYVMARLARERGVAVSVVALVDPAKVGGDAGRAIRDFHAAGLETRPFDGTLEEGCDLVVDAMLGSGLEREVGGDFRVAVEAANAQQAPIVALDVPTGLNGNTGTVMGAAIRAGLTVTFVGLKTGLVLGDGPALCGDIVFASLDIPTESRAGIDASFRSLPSDDLAKALPPRNRDAHKGRFGHVLIVGGGPGMPGAVRIAGEAALRTGAGLVSIATHPSHAAMVNAGRPELMVHPVGVATELEALFERASVIAVGPGLGQADWGRAMLEAVLAAGKPLVVDADALNLVAGRDITLPGAVLTPHPGEAARLLGVTTGDIQSDRCAALESLARHFDATVLLKGAGSLVSSGHGLPWICTGGNPGMASPGMGDALTGIIAALEGQGLDAEAAAIVGARLHARAGDAAAARGERGLLASDLIDELRRCVNP